MKTETKESITLEKINETLLSLQDTVNLVYDYLQKQESLKQFEEAEKHRIKAQKYSHEIANKLFEEDRQEQLIKDMISKFFELLKEEKKTIQQLPRNISKNY